MFSAFNEHCCLQGAREKVKATRGTIAMDEAKGATNKVVVTSSKVVATSSKEEVTSSKVISSKVVHLSKEEVTNKAGVTSREVSNRGLAMQTQRQTLKFEIHVNVSAHRPMGIYIQTRNRIRQLQTDFEGIKTQ